MAKNLLIEANIIIISIVFIALSSLPLIFIPGNFGYFSLFDGRALYLGNIFKSILLTDILFLIYLSAKRKMIPLLALFIIFFVASNFLSIRRDLDKETQQGNIRQSILAKVQKAYPKLSKKVVFYTESDNSYYGLSEKIMPFLSGFGQTLLVWYNSHGENFPACFFQDKYLYAIFSQEYKECEGRGYGYFREFNSLKEAVRKFKIDPKNIIAFKYISSKNEILDISIEIRKKLAL